MRSVLSLYVPHGPTKNLYQQIRWWYYHHAKAPKAPVPKAPLVLALTKKRSRKPVRLTNYQAYSRLFCQKGSSLHTKLHGEWTAFVENDEEAVKTYGHLFPSRDSKVIKFVAFQQAVLKQKMPTITKDESRQVEEFIEARFEEDNRLRDQPWQAMKVDKAQTDADLEKEYFAE